LEGGGLEGWGWRVGGWGVVVVKGVVGGGEDLGVPLGGGVAGWGRRLGRQWGGSLGSGL
jgi:hypothetical protein